MEKAALPVSLRLVRKTFLGNQLGLMNRIYGGLLAKKGIAWVETAPGAIWKVDLGDPCHRWMVYGDYADPGFLAWARTSVPEDGVVVDSGSNIGQFLPYFSNIVSSGRILSFEPSSYCTAWIGECLRQNEGMPVEQIRKGLGDKQGVFTLANQDGAHGLWGRVSQKNDSVQEGEEIEVVTLCSALSSRGVEHVDLWKLDVEGFELQALKGAESLLAENRIRALYVELSAENRRADVDYLQSFNYIPYRLRRNGELKEIKKHPVEEIDALFLPVHK